MNKFKQYYSRYISEAAPLTHLEHIEDLIIIDGYEGLLSAIKFLRQNLEVLKGNDNMIVQGKMDGAPAIIAGTDPKNGKFFVATKSLFNKIPKINYTNADIDNNHDSGVGPKLKLALEELPKLKFNGILQGDMLFDKSILKVETISGKKYVTFRPNTITYAVPYESALAKKIMKANIGIAWHTTYTGTDINDLSASFRININSHKEVPTIFNTDTNLHISSPLISGAEYEDIMNKIIEVENYGKKFNQDELSYLSNHKIDIMAYINSKVRLGSTVSDTMVTGFFDYINQKVEKEKEKLKTDKAKQSKEDAKKQQQQQIRQYAGTLWHVFIIHQKIQSIKSIIISKLNNIKSMDTFVETPEGYKVTTPEGYVAIDKLQDGAIKLVDRLEFSRNNFNIMKNWS